MNELPKRGILETTSDKNTRLIAESAMESNRLLARLVEIEAARRDADYAIWDVSATGRPAFTVRIGRHNNELLSEWLARQQDELGKMQAIRDAMIPTPDGKDGSMNRRPRPWAKNESR